MSAIPYDKAFAPATRPVAAVAVPPAYRAQMRVLHVSQPFPRALELVSQRLSVQRASNSPPSLP